MECCHLGAPNLATRVKAVSIAKSSAPRPYGDSGRKQQAVRFGWPVIRQESGSFGLVGAVGAFGIGYLALCAVGDQLNIFVSIK
jgi:hypothetical protein